MSINNFDFDLFKIRKEKLFDHIFTFFKNAKFTLINFAFANVFVEKILIEFDMSYIFQFSNDTIFNKTNISNYWNLNYQIRVQKNLNRHNNFFRNKLNKFNDDIEMLISFKNEIDVLNLKQNFYSFIVKNRKIMNEILNFLLKQNRIQKIFLNVFFVAVFSTFVVWKNEKFRIIMNFRKVNTRFYFDVYSLFRQNIIFNAFDEFVVFFSVDLTKDFFQQNTRQQNWWKTTFVTFHKKQKWLTISIMNLINTSNFFQHRMKKLLNSYLWKFMLIYVDDVIIYFSSLKQHIHHIDHVFFLLKNSDVTFSLTKCHFAYSNIKILNHHVSRLNFNTTKKKITTIKNMIFSKNLRDLKVNLKFFDYYRFFVDYYALIARFLMRFKIKNFANAFFKNRRRKTHFQKIRFKRSNNFNHHKKSFSLIFNLFDKTFEIDLSTTFECIKI